MVKLNTETHTLLQNSGEFQDISRENSHLFHSDYIFSNSSFCAITSKQVKLQFSHFIDTSRSRFVVVFCPYSTIHFSRKPAANDGW